MLMGVDTLVDVVAITLSMGLGSFFVYAALRLPGTGSFARVMAFCFGTALLFLGGSFAYDLANPKPHNMAAYRAYEMFKLDQMKRRLGVP
jgi:hypothetical protein